MIETPVDIAVVGHSGSATTRTLPGARPDVEVECCWLGEQRTCVTVLAEAAASCAHDFGTEAGPDRRGTRFGPAPLELLLAAAASCVTTTLSALATRSGIAVRSLSASVVGEEDARPIDRRAADGPALRRIRIRVDLDAEVGDAALDALLATVPAQSPVLAALGLPLRLERGRPGDRA
jgi:uncharacterized OsmC-like protein